ncbi:prolyl-tRNA synthetase associated domain-containing protein [Chitinophaga solisilvae]|uniref:prolyl-tRNA synthetase associated domain-containing protein n=1 Tax=Chitinophaga solisilvae TaxID=1233460 RepID=UPI001369E9F6|nr:YbaK/EbsC family protein [Chitinophaga solisilvae]
MFYVSEVKDTAPAVYKTALQEMVYQTLQKLEVPIARVDTDDAVTMEDCILINERLEVKTVKTLFLCNRQQTRFYLFVTMAGKPFVTRDFSNVMGISRLSFAPVELLDKMLGVPVGGTTIFGVMLDKANEIQVIIDQDVLAEEWYGCSDGTTTGYMKVRTAWIVNDFLTYAGHKPEIIQYN